jgi:hypothetical protein
MYTVQYANVSPLEDFSITGSIGWTVFFFILSDHYPFLIFTGGLSLSMSITEPD